MTTTDHAELGKLRNGVCQKLPKRTYRYKCEYLWHGTIHCEFTFRDVSLRAAKESCELFAAVKQKIRNASCIILKVTTA